MQLIKLELYKIFNQKIIYITFILFVLLSLSFGFERATHIEKELYKKWEGPLTENKVEKVKGELVKIERKQESMEIGDVFSFSNHIKMKLYNEIELLQRVENNVELRLNELNRENNYNTNLEIAMLQEIDLSYFNFHRGPSANIENVSFLWYVTTGAMLLLGLSSIFSNEYSSGVDQFILSTKKGRKALVGAKIAASIIYTFTVVISWEIWNLLFNFYKYGNEGWGTPLHLIFEYYFSPYPFNMLEFHLIQLGMHLLAAFTFTLLIILVSSLNQNSLTTFIISGTLFTTPLVLYEMIDIEWLSTTLKFSIIYVMKVEGLFANFETMKLFGYPLLYPIVAIVVMIGLSATFIPIIFKIIKHRQVTS